MSGKLDWRGLAAWLKVPALLLVVLAVAVPAAQGGSNGVIQRVTALEKKVKALQTTVSRLQGDLSAAKTDAAAAKSGVDCVRYGVLGVKSYGTPSSQEGYVYARAQNFYVTTALDVAPAGQQQAWIAVVNPSCVSSAQALRLSPHRSVAR
jgi:outer membrane murein-binding lipoprotein Lpp